MFFKGSRYEKVKTRTFVDAGGFEIRYKGIRLIPETPARLGHMVLRGERLDHIAHRYYKDARRFWRICDANLALWPDDLISESGRVLKIPPSEG